jgi:4-hydroxyphenylacetate 3-monooxygenase reductase component
MPIGRTAFRNIMAQFAAAVSVVTTDGAQGRCGFTCTSACSVTDEPATILVCLNRSSRMNPAFKVNGVFCVNVLGAGQENLSAAFAGQNGIDMAERFVRESWDTLATGAPVFRDAIAALDCSIVDIKECGTHTVMFGRVIEIRFDRSRDSLVYFNRRYHALPIVPEAFRHVSFAGPGAG